MSNQKTWLTRTEVADYLNIHYTTVWRKVQSKMLPPPYKLGYGTAWWNRIEIDDAILARGK